MKLLWVAGDKEYPIHGVICKDGGEVGWVTIEVSPEVCPRNGVEVAGVKHDPMFSYWLNSVTGLFLNLYEPENQKGTIKVSQ